MQLVFSISFLVFMLHKISAIFDTIVYSSLLKLIWLWLRIYYLVLSSLFFANFNLVFITRL